MNDEKDNPHTQKRPPIKGVVSSLLDDLVAVEQLPRQETMPQTNPGKNFGVVSTIIGILSIVIISAGLFIGLIGLALGIVGRYRSLKVGMSSSSALVGIITSIAGIALCLCLNLLR